MSKDRAWPGSQTQTTRDAGSAPSRSARYAIQPTEQSLLAVPDLALARYVATSRARHIPGELEDANDLRDNPGRDAGLGLNLHGGHRTAGQGQEDGGAICRSHRRVIVHPAMWSVTSPQRATSNPIRLLLVITNAR